MAKAVMMLVMRVVVQGVEAMMMVSATTVKPLLLLYQVSVIKFMVHNDRPLSISSIWARISREAMDKIADENE